MFYLIIEISNKFKNLQFDNDSEGFKKLLLSLPKAASYWFIMEATGNYGKHLAQFLYDDGHKVSVLNPVQVRYYAKSKLSRAKTDIVDARVIAQFAIAHNDLPTWQPLEINVEKLRNLSRCLVSLKDDAVKLQNRLEAIA